MKKHWQTQSLIPVMVSRLWSQLRHVQQCQYNLLGAFLAVTEGTLQPEAHSFSSPLLGAPLEGTGRTPEPETRSFPASVGNASATGLVALAIRRLPSRQMLANMFIVLLYLAHWATGYRLKLPRTEAATDRDGHKPKRPQTEMSTNWNSRQNWNGHTT